MNKNESRLLQDMERMAWLEQRRFVMRSIAAIGLIPIVGCGSSKSVSQAADANGTATSSGNTTVGNGNTTVIDSNTTTSACAQIPEETQGPYPGDGSNGPNALTQSGIVRSDITTSFGSYTGTAAGVPLTVKLRIVSLSGGCTSGLSRAVYMWHCDRDGNYSLYSVTSQNYLRGVQQTDADGYVTFQTIWPACYSGRWPHIHYEIFPSVASATSASSKTNTSQLAMPADVCSAVFATTGYSASIRNFTSISLSTDMVFSDGATLETPQVSGSVSDGYQMALQVAI